MSGDTPDFPPGWDEGILPAHWPDVLIGAVRRSAKALGSERVVATIVGWQQAARGPASTQQLEAKRRLAELHDALIGPAPTNIVDTDLLEKVLPPVRTRSLEGNDNAFTVDRFDLPPKPNLRRSPPARPTSAEPADDAIVAEDQDTDSKVKSARVPNGATPSFTEEDDRPTYAFARPDLEPAPPSAPVPAAPPPPPPDSQSGIRRRQRLDEAPLRGSAPKSTGAAPALEDDDGLPTRHISIPDDLLRRAASIAARPEATVMATTPPAPPKGPSSGPNKPPAPPVPSDDEATYALSAEEASALRPRPVAKGEEDGRLAPKPGVIQRRATRSRPSQASRPRASMQHVRPLYAVLKPFVDELLPLAVERRSRRFWARWREVAGERGVRREVVEELLESIQDPRTLLAELIAEVELADPKSVHLLIDRLEAAGGVEAARAPIPATPPERQRGQLVGAPVALDDDPEA